MSFMNEPLLNIFFGSKKFKITLDNFFLDVPKLSLCTQATTRHDAVMAPPCLFDVIML